MATATDNKQHMLNQIAANGVVGAGGAGFPTHVKLAGEADTIILNGAECEPLLHKDKEMMRHHGEQIVAGLRIAADLVGAKDIAIGVKDKYHDVIELMEQLLGTDGRVVPLSDSYPSGDEFILVYDVTGRVIPPGKIPLAVGCVVLNVETAYNIAVGLPVTDTFLTVAGAVRTPATLRVPVGITFREAIELAGGATVDNPHLLSGGVMMGKRAQLDDVITKTCGGLIVLPEDHFLVRRYDQSWRQISVIGASACDQCSFCTEFCPRYLLGHPIEPHKAMRSLGFVESRKPQVIGTQFCCECNLCTMIACPEDLDPKNVCTTNKRELASAGQRWETEAHPYRAELHLDNRRVPISRLILKLGLKDFENTGPLKEPDYQARRVRIPLAQHIGKPAEPVIEDRARVKKGDLLAKPAEGALGAAIHASIAGTAHLEGSEVVIDAN
jgi:Na+-translocating ferredoxin:NAD+ oxidoreductase RnfC subunit